MQEKKQREIERRRAPTSNKCGSSGLEFGALLQNFLSREFCGFLPAQVSDRGGDGRVEDVREKRERIRAVYRARNRFARNLPQTLLHYSEFFSQ
jgi:hypothetical protein